jgi:hypothetical protein
MRFPDQLHRTSTVLFELEVLENTTYLLSKVSLRESDRALDTHSQWEKHFDIFTDQKAA